MQPSPTWRHQLSRRFGISVISLHGELDLASVPGLQSVIFDEIEAAEVTGVQVDLSQVGFLDSTALGLLISALNLAKRENKAFSVVNPSPVARRILGLTGLHEVLITG